VLRLLGGLFLLVLFVAGGIGVALFLRVRVWVPESREYLRSTLPKIGDGWNVGVFEREEADVLRAKTPDDQLADLLRGFRECPGALTVYRTEKVVSVAWHVFGDPLVAYDVDANFVRSAGTVRVTLVKHGGRWQYAGLFMRLPRPCSVAPPTARRGAGPTNHARMPPSTGNATPFT
jgi:hypothetical protein